MSSAWALKVEGTYLNRAACFLAADGPRANLDAFSPDERPKILEVLRGIESGTITSVGGIAPYKSGARLALIALSDEPTIEKTINIYRQYKSRAAWVDIPQAFQTVSNPITIDYLAPDFYLEDDLKASYGYRNEWESIGAPPRSIWSSIVSVRIIEKSPKFSQAMKVWAKDVYELSSRDEALCRRVMRAWWTKNKDLFEQRRYMEVQPINLRDFEPEVASEPSPKPEQVPVVRKVPEPRKIEAASPTSAPMPVVRVLPVESSSNWPLILCGAVIALMVGVFGFRVLRK